MVAACMPWLVDTTFNRSLGSLYSFVHYVRTPSLPQVPNLGSLSTHKLRHSSLYPELWVERQSKAAHINMWGFGDLPSPPDHFRPHCGKNFLINFIFLWKGLFFVLFCRIRFIFRVWLSLVWFLLEGNHELKQVVFRRLRLSTSLLNNHPPLSQILFSYWPIHRQHWPLIGPTLMVPKMT